MAIGARWIVGAVAVLGIVGGGWFYVNYDPKIGGVFFVLSMLTLLIAIFSNQISAYFKAAATSAGTIKYRFTSLLLLGFVLGLIPAILSLSFGLSIGIPSLSVATELKIIATVILAPIVEEGFFLFAVPFLLGRLMTGFGPIGWVINMIGSSFIFSIYHWLVYGAVFELSGDFLVAFIFRFLTLLLVSVMANGWRFYETTFTLYESAQAIIPAILMHGMFNGAVAYQKLFVRSEVTT